jgi:hypothetical protein
VCVCVRERGVEAGGGDESKMLALTFDPLNISN